MMKMAASGTSVCTRTSNTLKDLEVHRQAP
jgi:hypothetical protein